MSHYQIGLDALLSRNVNVQWFEGVALVQAVCRQLTASRSATAGFPPSGQILLCNDGSVTVLGSSWGGEAVEGAARMLADLQTDDAPVQLRLLLTQAGGSDGTYPTLSDFSTALAYFERSAPDAMLQQLFERAVASGPRDEPRPQMSELAPVEKDKRPAEEARKRGAGRHSQSLVALAVVLAVAAAAGWFFALGPGRAHLAAAGVSVMKQLGLGTPGDADAQPVASNEPVEKDTRSPRETSASAGQRARADSRSTPRTSAAPGNASIPEPGPGMPFRIGEPSTAQLMPDLPDGIATYVISASPPGTADVDALLADEGVSDGLVYSANDSQVQPPRHVYPVFPEPPANLDLRNKTIIDVVVDNDGLVESVRLRNRPRDILEFMLVSAAKAWRFEPAMLDGRPVRFLHSLTLVRQ